MTNKPQTKHLIRIDHDLYIKLEKLAKEDSRSVTVYLDVLLRRVLG